MSKYLFVTGKLAFKALEKTLAGIDLCEGYRIEALGSTVAALMNTEFIARHVAGAREDIIVIPGLCKGPLEVIKQTGIYDVLKGPEDLKDLPQFFGKPAGPEVFSKPKLKILAEIVDAPNLTTGEVLERARDFAAHGADIIDIGTETSGEFGRLAEIVKALKAEGFQVSIDSLRPKDILAAVDAGADMVLSINSSNIHVADRINARLVVIPDDERDLTSLFKNVEKLLAAGKEIVADPILPPLMFGFTEAVQRYIQVRKRFPEVPVLMGAGNVTELTDADSTGINAVLAGMATELDIDYMLTTEVSARARGAIRELSLARDLMHCAKEKGRLPKHIDYSLITVKDPETASYTQEELFEMHKLIKDKNFRIFTCGSEIYIFNTAVFLHGKSAAGLFAKLCIDDPKHAFYLGVELSKAELALKLGKKYTQDKDLRWGYLNDY